MEKYSTSTEVETFNRAFGAARRLKEYRAVVRRPCRYCGCRVYFPVVGGLRCASCCPPLGMPEASREIVRASFDMIEGVVVVEARWPD